MQSLIRRRPPAADPAPSRWSYRMHRLWLTPLVRRLLRVGLPAFVAAFALGLYLSDEGRRGAWSDAFAGLRDEVKNRPEFMVSLISVEGASPPLAELVRTALALPLPQSSLDLDLGAAQARVTSLPAVKGVHLRVQPGGILQVRVQERVPALVWRVAGGLILLDDTGNRIAGIAARADRADLPLVAGEGADVAAAEALALIAEAAPLHPRLRGLVRMGHRRWDIVLDRDQRILLPEHDPKLALERLLALDAAQGLLSRDVLAVDLRIAERPALQLAPHALTELRRARGLVPPETAL